MVPSFDPFNNKAISTESYYYAPEVSYFILLTLSMLLLGNVSISVLLILVYNETPAEKCRALHAKMGTCAAVPYRLLMLSSASGMAAVAFACVVNHGTPSKAYRGLIFVVAAGCICVPLGSYIGQRIIVSLFDVFEEGGDDAGGSGGDGRVYIAAGAGAQQAPAPAPRSIAALVDAATAGVAGVSAAQREFAAKMITGMGIATEKDFGEIFEHLDWGRHLPGFPALVELHLKRHFCGGGGGGKSGASGAAARQGGFRGGNFAAGLQIASM